MDRETDLPLHRQFALEAMKREYKAKEDKEFDSFFINTLLVFALGWVGAGIVVWRLIKR